jgi:TRAP-type C4-dicarboxylate transport system permease small subunit
MSGAARTFIRINHGFGVLQRWFLFLITAILSTSMFIQIVTRYFFGTSLFGLEQFIGYTAVWLYFVGAAYGSYERSHIKAEFIGVMIKTRRKLAVIRAFAALVSTAMSVVFAVWSWEFCVDSLKMGETTPTMGVPMIWFQAALFIGALLMIYYFLWEFIDWTRRAILNLEPPEESRPSEECDEVVCSD